MQNDINNQVNPIESKETAVHIDLKEIYKELTRESIFRSKKTTLLFQTFVTLMAQKSSFAHKVHKQFSSLTSVEGYPY